MDALDKLIDVCRLASLGPDPMAAVLTEVSAANLDGVLAAIRARPQPWFFVVGTDLTVFTKIGRAHV